MGMDGDTALTLAKNYVKKTLQGQGALKGQDGFSPIIEENADNTDKVYKLDITTADSAFTTPNLRGKDGESSGGGEANVIESISVNGTHISVDENKNVDITVPSIDGLAKTEDIPTKVSELTNDSGYLTEHQDISGKVDKVEGKSLISDTEIARLASVDNYDDTDIKAEIAKKADTTSIPRKVSELTNDSNYQTAEQVSSTVTTEIAKVVADAPESLNTLKEMSDWIAGHENDASAMNSAISDNKTAITALQTGKADKSEIPTTVAELSDSADYAKTTDIPTTLPADGGNADTVNNHTVETDVPTDAVFTDTVYDDTKIKYGEIAGGKNLFNGNFIEDVLEAGINYTDVKLIKEQNSVKDIKGITFAVFGAYLKKGTYTFSYTNDAYFSLNRVAIAGTDCVLAIESIRKSYTWTQNTDGWTYFGIEGDDSETGVTDTPFSVTPDIQIEKGAQATAYETYIPSIKMLEDEVSEQNESLSVIGKCKNLLNPTLETTTLNGVTCTAIGDGTYTINGTASAQTTFVFAQLKSSNLFKNGITYKFCGCPKLNNNIWFVIEKNENPYTAYVTDYGNGGTFTYTSNDDTIDIFVRMNEGIVLNNVVLKPMVTTNLNATYDDFAPYTGDGDTLTHDVAEIKNDLSVKKFELVAGVLWLCVSGKHCVLTLNGYNLTEPTHFDKLEEYQPYLVARNVVSNGDSVCIAAVEPNGNINASDLVVGTSLTGQLFGEISWIANI